jgi:hypothetical protein
MSNPYELQNPTSPQLGGYAEQEAAAVRLRQGQKYRRNSIIIGVIGLIVFGIAAGIFAFYMARKAEAHGVKATAGKVLAVLDVIGGIVIIVLNQTLG